MAQAFVDSAIKDNKCAVFSKTYCPFCKMAKEALDADKAKYLVIELDERGKGWMREVKGGEIGD